MHGAARSEEIDRSSAGAHRSARHGTNATSSAVRFAEFFGFRAILEWRAVWDEFRNLGVVGLIRRPFPQRQFSSTFYAASIWLVFTHFRTRCGVSVSGLRMLPSHDVQSKRRRVHEVLEAGLLRRHRRCQECEDKQCTPGEFPVKPNHCVGSFT